MTPDKVNDALASFRMGKRYFDTDSGEYITRGDVWGRCTLVVTYMDGHVEKHLDTAFLLIPGFKDPIHVDGTTVEIENMERTTTLCGVRHFHHEFPREI